MQDKKSIDMSNGITPQAIPFCVKNRSLCYKCDHCEATYLELPNGRRTFYTCGCRF